MRRTLSLLILAGLGLVTASTAGAQLLPRPPQLPGLPPVGGVAGDLLRPLDELGQDVRQVARRLARQRLEALDELVRAHPGELEMTRDGPAVRGEIVVIDPQPAALAAVAAAGFAVLEREAVEDLGFEIVTLR